jgi:TPR repeat protein
MINLRSWRFHFLSFLIGMILCWTARAEDISSSDFDKIQAKAETGDAEAQTKLGKWYCNESSNYKDYAQAASWFRRAADQGYSGGQFGLGTLYFFGTGVEQDYAKAIQWIQKAAEQDDAIAQCTLGRLYFDGVGVAKNFVEAYKWFDLSAKHESLLAIRCRDITASHMTAQEIDFAREMSSQFLVKPKSVKLAMSSGE